MHEFIRDSELTIPDSINNMQDIIDIEGVYNLTWVNYIELALIIILASLIIIGIFILLRKLRSKFKNEDSLPPYESFINDLKKLRMQKWFAEKEQKKLYFFLSESVRRFIQGQFQYAAPDKTLEEIKNEFLNTRNNAVVNVDYIKEFLNKAELIKFSNILQVETQVEKDLTDLSEWANKQTKTK